MAAEGGPMNVGIVGATGQVGGVMRSVLAARRFPVSRLRLFATARSAGRRLPWGDEEIEVEDSASTDWSGLDLALVSVGSDASRELSPRMVAGGALVVDNSSAWRMDPHVPLVVPEANAHALASIPKGIIANPNCTTMVGIPVLKPLHDEAGLRRVIVSTYQSVSGGGLAAVAELESQVRKTADDSAALTYDGAAVDFPAASKFRATIAFNVVPMNFDVVDEGYT